MASVRWTAQARNDLEEACLYIARDSATSAESLRVRILSVVELLASSPRSGRVVPELTRDDVRELIVQRFRVMYRLLGDDVEILRVWHGARLLRRRDLPPDAGDKG